MKKDIFNGKIKQEYANVTIFFMFFAMSIFVVCAIFFICVAQLYNNIEETARIAMYVIAGISIGFAIFFPIATIFCVRSYPKHKRLAHLFVKPYAFAEDVSTDEQSSENEEQ